MKKKLLIAGLLATAVMTSAGALSACNNTEAHKCENVCPICNKCTTDCTDDVCKDKCEGHIDMTEGVYNCKMGSYDLLIKFYSDTEYYLQNETTGYRGKYEIKNEEITFSKSQEDGTDYNTAEHGDKAGWVTGNKVIYFYQEDGTTPIDYDLNSREANAHDATTVIKGICYAYGTKPHTLAYNTETDKIQSFKGNYGSRTLSHSTLRDFTINDEKAIEQAKYMVKTLPDEAEAGKVESDYFLTLSQKGYETNIPALQDLGFKAGKFTKEGTVYTLTDTITSKKATLTVTETGATLVLANDETKKVELVNWADVTPYAAEVKGSAFGGKIQATVRFNEDGTLTIFGSTKNYGGKYKAAKDGTITISDVDADSPVNIISASFATADDVTTMTAKLEVLTNKPNDGDKMDVTATGTVTGKLFGLSAVTVLQVESKETTSNMHVLLEMKDNCTLVLSVGGQEKIKAFWNLNTETKEITFKKTSDGTLSYSLNNYAPYIKWTGKLDESQTEDETYTFDFAAADLAKLVGAKVAEKYAVKTDAGALGEVTLTLLADGTVKFGNERTTLATAEWALKMNGYIPGLEFGTANVGTFTGASAEDSQYKVTWVGTVPSMGEKTIEFLFPMSDFAKLQ